jgi:hypothetical protein
VADAVRTLPGNKFKDLTGATFNGVTALHPLGKRGNTYLWRFRCHCGEEFTTTGSRVALGETKSCGCLLAWRAAKVSRTPEYRSWRSMIARCCDPSHKSYPSYGGRGIEVCDRWLTSLSAFLADMGPRPSKRHSLDRIDNDQGYSPDNCRWATQKVQSNNTRTNRLLTFGGRTLTLTEWAEEVGLPRRMIGLRLGRGWSVERALTRRQGAGDD